MARRTKKTKSFKIFHTRWSVLGVIVLLALLAVSAWALPIRNHNKPSIPTNGNPATPSKSYVNLSPATDQDKQDTENHKKDLSQTSTPTPTTADGKRLVTPIITHGDQNTLNSYVSGVFEDGGTCTATITNTSTSQVITKSSQGFENASYTSCAPITSLGLGSGIWQAVLSYSSSTSAGSSSPYTIKVP